LSDMEASHGADTTENVWLSIFLPSDFTISFYFNCLMFFSSVLIIVRLTLQ
jgi:hypothetical protein